jgi:hypothetical protein
MGDFPPANHDLISKAPKELCSGKKAPKELDKQVTTFHLVHSFNEHHDPYPDMDHDAH